MVNGFMSVNVGIGFIDKIFCELAMLHRFVSRMTASLRRYKQIIYRRPRIYNLTLYS